MKSLFRVAPLALFALAAAANAKDAPAPFSHEIWGAVLQARVNPLGEVDYAALKKDRTDLDRYLAQLREASPRNRPDLFPSDHHRLAYWLNAYNAFTVQGVVDNYPTGSIRDLGFLFSFFRKKIYSAGGETLSLDDIEHKILRKEFHEPRIHFAIVCASVSCPRLSSEAFEAAAVERHLDRLARQFINEERNVSVDRAKGRVTLSKIFDWFGEDFESSAAKKGDGALLAYIRVLAGADLAVQIESLAAPKVNFHDYDWGLNRPGSRAASKNALERALAAKTVSIGNQPGQ